jgi:dTDP-4-dehydrorhamnose 3,5-epimerase-like enzyme
LDDRPERTTFVPGRLDLVRWIHLPSHRDQRGVLTAVEGGVDVPFEIRRAYFLHGITSDRGGHAHMNTYQIVVAVSGRCELVLSDSRESRVFALDDPTRGLFLVPMLFIQLRSFTTDAVVLVLASTRYDKAQSIRSWEDYLAVLAR